MIKYRLIYNFVLILLFLPVQFVFPQDSSQLKPESKTERFDNKISADNISTGEESAVTTTKTFDKDSFNYFRIDHTGKSLWNGKHWQPEDYPLNVFVKNCSSKLFKSLYKTYVDYAFGVWEKADQRIKFQYVSGEADADITIVFEESLVEKYDDSYLGMTDYKLSAAKEIEKSVIEISMLKFNSEMLSDGEIKATIIHELGHALGLGHSDNDADIMFPFISPFSSSDMSYDELSGGDIMAVRSVVDLGYKSFSMN